MNTRIKINFKKTLQFISFSTLFSLNTYATNLNFEPKPASPATVKSQQKFLKSLPVDDGRDEAFVRRGFIASLDDPITRDENGGIVYDPTKLDFIEGEAPDTVNPSLWRQMKLLKVHGLFKVVDGMWQVRAFDGSNMTLISGDTGWIIIDPMMVTETAKSGMKLVNKHLGKRPVKAVIYTHAHPDHFGGVRGVLGEGTTNAEILAPENFLEETTSEYLMAGNIMGRRVSYQFGSKLDFDPKGNVGGGIVSVAVSANGTIRLIEPTDIIKTTGDTRIIDGVKLEFQMVPETESPAEMNVYVPSLKTFYISEFATCTMHNLQTPRGALARDALQWADFLTEALDRYGKKSEAIAAGHCWPRFGNDEVKSYLSLQRDNYKFIHDQTVRMMNQGATALEIADEIQPPPAIANEWSNRGYYGTLRHNAKGVFQRYIGWWDGIPAHLNLHPPTESGKRYVKAIGGAKYVIKEAESAMDQGDYRWSAELLNHLVFAEPENNTAKALLADSYEQMGYQAESAIWRNYFLTGADELRGESAAKNWVTSPDLPATITTIASLEVIATRLNPIKIADQSIKIMLNVTDTDEQVSVTIKNAVMVSQVGNILDSPDATLTGSKETFMALFLLKKPIQIMEKNGLRVQGNRKALTSLLDAIEIPAEDFSVVVP